MAALTHRTTIAVDDPLRIELSVRARNRARGAVELYERDPVNGHMRKLGGRKFTTGPRWDRVTADFAVRDTDRPVLIFVYLDAAPGTRFGVRDITIRKPVAAEIPADWIPRTLAREYLRALLRR